MHEFTDIHEPIALRTVAPDGRQPAPVTLTRLQPKSAALFRLLARQAGQLVTRQTLLEELWNGDASCDAALTSAVCALRRQLGDRAHCPRAIETVPGRGYRLIAPVPADQGGESEFAGIQHARMPGSASTSSPQSRWGRLIGDLSRRRVFRALAVYLVIGWVMVQIGEATFEPLGIPDWCMSLLILLIALGFPVAAVLAWAFQITPEGIVLDLPGANLKSPASTQAKRPMQMLMAASLVVVIAVLGFRLVTLETRMARAAIPPGMADVVDAAVCDEVASVTSIFDQSRELTAEESE